MKPTAMEVPLLDLRAQYASIRDEIEPVLREIQEAQMFILGPHVARCEERIAAYSGVAHGIGVSSGTDALLMALMAEGVGPGDEVVTTPFTFFATAGCIHRVGARPVFVDIDPLKYNIDPAGVERAVTGRTRAILPVHLFGHMAKMDPIMEVARARGIAVIEDAAQAIGAEYAGRRAGSIGDYGCFSFFPSKNLGCFGDGGMIVTRDGERAARLRKLRNHGMEPKYYHAEVGGNFRLDALQAAVVTAKLAHLDAWTEGRRENARQYHRLFADSGLVERGVVALPCPPDDCTVPGCRITRHVYNQFCIRVPQRDALKAHLAEAGVGSEIYYPVPLHLQECFRHLGHREGDFPVSEQTAREILALPVYPELSPQQLEHVVSSIAAFYG